MDKIFIASPIIDKDFEIYQNELTKRAKVAELLVGHELELIQTWIPQDTRNPYNKLAVLSKLIFLLSQADYVYFVDGWRQSDDCRILHECAVRYGLNILND